MDFVIAVIGRKRKKKEGFLNIRLVRFFRRNQYYGEEELRAELEDTKKQLAQEREDRRQAEEKIEQLEAKTRGVSPTNNFPALQGNILRTRIVVNPLFREVIGLKGSKTIYANIIIDMSRNKYIRLEPL